MTHLSDNIEYQLSSLTEKLRVNRIFELHIIYNNKIFKEAKNVEFKEIIKN